MNSPFIEALLAAIYGSPPPPPGPVFSKELEPGMTPRTQAPGSRLDSTYLEKDARTNTPFDLSTFNADTTPYQRRGR